VRTAPVDQASVRYHGLDGLRAFAMSLGIVIHASVPYWAGAGEIALFWPTDKNQSPSLGIVAIFIHTWRMPLFFLLAGFFAHLVLERRSTRHFAMDRLKRIAVPLAIFGPVMALTLPMLWIYGATGRITLGTLSDISLDGQPFGHLWFLYYLIILYGMLLLLRAIGQPLSFAQPVGRMVGRAIYTKIPVAFVLLTAVLVIVRGEGGEDKTVWPINVPDLLYSALFFLYGYGLYNHRDLIDKLRSGKMVSVLLAVATISFFAQLALADVEGLAGLVLLFSHSSATVGLSLGLIGLFERYLTSHNPRIRWLADSSYWIYIIHMPVVALLTFYLLNHDLNANLKFALACTITGVLGLVTYRYFVRYTPLGTLLNGKRFREVV